MKVNDDFLIVIDEQGYYRLLKRNNDVFSEVVWKIKAESKDDAKKKFEEMNLFNL